MSHCWLYLGADLLAVSGTGGITDHARSWVMRVDGTRSVAAIAKACGVSFEAAKDAVDELERNGLVEYQGRPRR